MVKKIWYLLILLFVWLLLTAGTEDYYSRLDNLLGQTVEVMAKANALPIVTGVADECRTIKTESNYYNAAIKLADETNNYSWAAYQNSKKLNNDYKAKKSELIALDQVGNGEKAFFLDEISGKKYYEEEQRYKKNDFFKQFKKGIGSADIYIDNIGLPEKLLEDLFDLDIPELPDTEDNKFENNIPGLKVEPLEKWQDKIISAISNDSINEQLKSYWQIIIEPTAGNFNKRQNNLIQVNSNQPVLLGIKIINPEGKVVLKERDLAKFQPYITSLPLLEDEPSKLNLLIDKENKGINPQENQKSLKKGVNFSDDNLPNVQLGKAPLIINYNLAPDIDIVELNIYNSKGKLVHSLKESKPNPLNPLPFVWNTQDSDSFKEQNPLEPGNYTINLVGLDKNNNIFKTTDKLINVTNIAERKTLKIEARKVINNGDNNYYGYINLEPIGFNYYGLEKIYAWLHGSEDNFDKPISAALYTSFASFDPAKSYLNTNCNSLNPGSKCQIRVVLINSFGQPVPNASVSIYSRRNRHRKIDNLNPALTKTNSEGIAVFNFQSNIPGEAEIYALSDFIWINEKPLIIKINNIIL